MQSFTGSEVLLATWCVSISLFSHNLFLVFPRLDSDSELLKIAATLAASAEPVMTFTIYR
jgi:hypothetical protein